MHAVYIFQGVLNKRSSAREIFLYKGCSQTETMLKVKQHV